MSDAAGAAPTPPEPPATPAPPRRRKPGTGKQNGGGSPPHRPTVNTRRKVKMLAGLGFTQDEIALLLDVGKTVLNKYYAKELRVGALEADYKVLGNLFRLATQSKDLQVASRNGIFWAKVRRRWHEVQRVIHGYDPETIMTFVRETVKMLRRELPDNCPACKTKLNLSEKVAAQLYELSQQMAARLRDSEVVDMPVPELAHDGMDKPNA